MDSERYNDILMDILMGKPNLTIFVPTRGRPDSMNEFASHFEATRRDNSKVVFIVDEDDPVREQYIGRNKTKSEIVIAPPSARGMTGALNYAFRLYQSQGKLGYAIGFMGDDHRPRTEGWDTRYLTELLELKTGFVYGDDLLQGELLPTQVAFTTDIGVALGYMSPPSLQHLCVDTYWLALGQHIDRIKYLDDVVVEHLHPLAGKARFDKGYRAVNNSVIANRDSTSYRLLHESGKFQEDVNKLLMLIETGYTESW